jgi:hypothetical protein
MFLLNLLVALPAPATGAEFLGQTYTSRQVFADTAIFSDCAFQGCRTSLNGGGINLFGESAGLTISGCLFTNCEAVYGGAVFSDPCRWFSLSETVCRGCRAKWEACLDVVVFSSAGGSCDVHDSAMVSSAGSIDTVSLSCYTYASGATSVVESLNSSANSATDWGSGMFLGNHYRLAFRFSVFTRDGPSSCVLLSALDVTGDISCLALVNDTCTSKSDHPGLLFVRPTVTMTSCVFQSNHFDYFLGTDQRTSHVSFVRCVFDGAPNKTNSISFAQSNCTFVIAPTIPAECTTRTAPPTRTATTPPRTRPATTPPPTSEAQLPNPDGGGDLPESHVRTWLIIVIVGACVLFVVVAGLVVWIVWQRSRNFVLAPLHCPIGDSSYPDDSPSREWHEAMVRWKDRERL